MSFRITFLNQKGGVGKSTAAALIAAVLQEAGYRVAVDDRDSQKTLEFWAKEVGRIPLLGTVENPDIIITDTPGRLDLQQPEVLTRFRELVSASQRIVLVSEKTLFSLHAAAPMLRVIRDTGIEASRVKVLFNKVRQGTCIGRQDNDTLADKLGVQSLVNSLPLSACFERMETEGLAPIKGAKRELVQALALELVS